MSDKRCGILSAHDPHAWGDLNWCPGAVTSVPPTQPPAARLCPSCGTGDVRYAAPGRGHAEGCSWPTWTSVPPTQPPAAPETDVSAWVEVLRDHLVRDRYDEEGESLGTYCTCGGWSGDYFADGEPGPFDLHLAEVIERIVAERVRVVEGERDRWQDKAQEAGEAYANANSRHHEELDRANRLERLADRLAERAVELEDDAREATARAESAEAAHAALVKVLDEYFDFDVDPWDDHDAACPAPEDVWRLHRDLRALLAGGAS